MINMGNVHQNLKQIKKSGSILHDPNYCGLCASMKNRPTHMIRHNARVNNDYTNKFA